MCEPAVLANNESKAAPVVNEKPKFQKLMSDGCFSAPRSNDKKLEDDDEGV